LALGKSTVKIPRDSITSLDVQEAPIEIERAVGVEVILGITATVDDLEVTGEEIAVVEENASSRPFAIPEDKTALEQISDEDVAKLEQENKRWLYATGLM